MTRSTLLALFLSFLFPFFSSSVSARNSKGKFVVVIDPGHGGKDAGALGTISKEKDIVLKVGLKVRELLRKQDPGIAVLMTRSTDVFIGLNERADYANRNHADLFVSIHANSVKSKSARGIETYTLGLARSEENLRVAMKENSVILKEDDYKTKYEGFDPNSTESYIMFEFMQNKNMESSIKLAQNVQKNLVVGGRRVNRGVKQNIFLVLRRTSMPSILIELGFISDRQEENYMNSVAGIDEMARSISSAVIKYKQDLDKKLSAQSAQSAPQPPAEEVNASTKTSVHAETQKASAPEGEKRYRIQILTHSKKIDPSDARFKGYGQHLKCYRDGDQYKYTLYDFASQKEALEQQKKLKKVFNGCFIVTFVGDKRVD